MLTKNPTILLWIVKGSWKNFQRNSYSWTTDSSLQDCWSDSIWSIFILYLQTLIFGSHWIHKSHFHFDTCNAYILVSNIYLTFCFRQSLVPRHILKISTCFLVKSQPCAAECLQHGAAPLTLTAATEPAANLHKLKKAPKLPPQFQHFGNWKATRA